MYPTRRKEQQSRLHKKCNRLVIFKHRQDAAYQH